MSGRSADTLTPPASPATPRDHGSGLRGFLTGPGLPVFLLAAVAVYEAFLLAILLAPESAGAWAGFAREFKQWCFQYDPRTGGMKWAAVWVMLGEPAFIAFIALWLARRAFAPLRTARAWLAHWKPAACGASAAALAMAALFHYGRSAAAADDAPLPFPGERIRTHLQPPPFEFVDHRGRPFRLEDVRGRAVLLTGVYAACPTGACSEILRETRALLDALPPEAHAHLTVAALSLNPKDDTAELRNGIAEAYGFAYPQFRYLNGDADTIRDVATRLGFAPVFNPATGAIDHANLFLLIDNRGQIAYRLALGGRHRSWLREGILALTAEARNP